MTVTVTTPTTLIVRDSAARGPAGPAGPGANDAYAQANTARVTANDAFIRANSAANTTAVSANSGTLLNNKVLNFNNTASVLVLVEENSGNANISFTAVGGGGGGDPSAAYNQANAAYGQANNAYAAANTANTNALAAYGQANTAYSQANSAYGQANDAYNQANTVYGQANAAYAAANTANTNALNAYAQANNAYAEANLKLNLTGGTITGSLNVANVLKANVLVSTSTNVVPPNLANTDGERLRLYDFNIAGRPNYALGVEGNHIWMGVDDNGGTTGFKWYGNTTQVGLLRTNSTFQVSNTVEARVLRANGTGTAIDAGSGNILTNQVTGTQFNFLSGLYTASITGGGSVTTNYTLKLPPDLGSNGQLLTTDGTGNTSWTTSSGGDPSAAYAQANAAYNQANSNYLPAVTRLDVTNNGATAYRFDQYGATVDDPTIYVRAGETIAFNLNNAGHPFAIRVSNGGANYNTGLIHVATNGTVSNGSSAQGQTNGTLYWKVPHELGGNTYVYQCTAHAGMVGNVVIEPSMIVAYAQANAAYDAANAATAATVDITDTNGLTTVYYPTFVENRANGQIVRADVDLSYRTDDNKLTVGNISTGSITFSDNTVQNTAYTGGGASLPLANGASKFDIAVANGYVTINANVFVWTFDETNGSIDLPGNVTNFGACSAINFVANSSGDGNGYSTIELRPDSNAGSDQYLIIDPTAPGHIHIRAGGQQDDSNADLIIGGENSHFKVSAGANAEVSVRANSHQFVYGDYGHGTLRFPNLTYAQLPQSPNIIAGQRAFITDANLAASGNFGAVISGSGANVVPVWTDGTDWRIG